jgi:hypothetical protein
VVKIVPALKTLSPRRAAGAGHERGDRAVLPSCERARRLTHAGEPVEAAASASGASANADSSMTDINLGCMSKQNRRIVSPNPKGGWDVNKPGASRASSHHANQGEAQSAARRYLRNEGGGELSIQGRNGRIRAKDSVPPGHDPYPPKG